MVLAQVLPLFVISVAESWGSATGVFCILLCVGFRTRWDSYYCIFQLNNSKHFNLFIISVSLWISALCVRPICPRICMFCHVLYDLLKSVCGLAWWKWGLCFGIAITETRLKYQHVEIVEFLHKSQQSRKMFYILLFRHLSRASGFFSVRYPGVLPRGVAWSSVSFRFTVRHILVSVDERRSSFFLQFLFTTDRNHERFFLGGIFPILSQLKWGEHKKTLDMYVQTI
jgi:hypothetical protein